MTRLSQYFLPTTREAPADAEAASHRLTVRAGLARQVGAGLWTWLPAGWRSHRRVEQIVREELDAIGSGEMLMPVLQPSELWKTSGRYDIDEVFKLEDRRGAELVLAMTHEENLTFHIAREVRSYRDLPKLLYHFQTKERDEPRPRAGVLRTREFIMKDAYSFDRDREGLDHSYQLHVGAYDRIFDRSGLEWYRVESDVGMMGGFGAHEYMAPCPAGENDVALSDAGYAANVEVASATAQPVPGLPEGLPEPRAEQTPGATTIEAVARMLEVPPGALIKAFPVVVEERGPLLIVTRGDHRLNEIKLQNALGAPFRAAEPDEVREQFGAQPGFIGPWGARSRSWPTKPCVASPGSWPAETNPTCTWWGSSRGGTSSPPGPTCAAWSPATPAPAAARFGSSPPSRWGTSSSWAPASRSRSAPATSTRRARSS